MTLKYVYKFKRILYFSSSHISHLYIYIYTLYTILCNVNILYDLIQKTLLNTLILFAGSYNRCKQVQLWANCKNYTATKGALWLSRNFYTDYQPNFEVHYPSMILLKYLIQNNIDPFGICLNNFFPFLKVFLSIFVS